MSAAFWFIAGMLAGVAATLVANPLWRGIDAGVPRRRRMLLTAAAVATFVASAAVLYLMIGSPRTLDRSRQGSAAPHPMAGTSAPGAQASSIEAATAGLEARLARGGGSPSEWQLLAQSYDFLGRTEDAQRARARAADPASAGAAVPARSGAVGSTMDVDAATVRALLPSTGVPTSPGNDSIPAERAANADVAQLEQQVSKQPRNAQAWLALANARRELREYPAAAVAYHKVIALHAMDAQGWADYADALGSLPGSSLGGDAGRAIDRALAEDPRNAKALWLKATRAYQEHRYAEALRGWRALKAVLPADSADARLIDANIDEARQLSGESVAAAPVAPQAETASTGAPNDSAEIAGTVSIDTSLAGRVDRNATLFIYAKAADSPGAPLAVLRTTAASWPVAFRLDDSMAMLPSRRLSQFQKVIIEARISRTGQATPSAGDLYTTSDVVHPGTTRNLVLVINREIG